MTNNIHLTAPASCSACGFSTTDIHLLANHSCEVQAQGGRCEDFPACGHELGDCNGQLYGSDEAIKSDPHLLCDHNTGYCEVWDREQDEDEAEEDCCDGTGWTGNPTERCLDHYQPLDSIWFGR